MGANSVRTKRSTRSIGSDKEELACEYLEANGYTILDRNFHGGRFAELDIVARDSEDYLCFVEVKYRRDSVHGGCEGTIDRKKIKRISNCANYYIFKNDLSPDTPIRFDVVFIVDDDITLIPNAFEYAP